MTTQLGQSSTMVGAASSGALAPRLALTVAARAGAPPSAELAWEALATRIDGGSVSVKFARDRALFIVVLVLNHMQQRS
jgi:hypothetical protein